MSLSLRLRPVTSTPRSRRSSPWSAWPWGLTVLLVAFARLLWSARAAGPAGALSAGVVAAAAAFAVHSGFDFVWHLPAVVLATVLLLVGVILPAPQAPMPASPSVPFEERG